MVDHRQSNKERTNMALKEMKEKKNGRMWRKIFRSRKTEKCFY